MWSEQQINETIMNLHEVLQHVLENAPHDKCRISRHYGALITLYRVLDLYDQADIVIDSYRKWRHENHDD